MNMSHRLLCRPLVVDLDQTLIRSDMLIESGFAYLKSAPLRFYRPLVWLARGGKQALKSGLAENTDVDVTALPYDLAVLDWLKEEREAGRQLVLATASHERYAHAIAEHLGIFEQTFATDSGVNLTGRCKRDRIVAEFGEKEFDYVGNSWDDVIVWQSAACAYIVNPSTRVERAAQKIGNVERVFVSRSSQTSAWAKSLRLHQWLKNILVFVPLLAAHQFKAPALICTALLAFFAFGLCASSVYLLNDLLDLEDDRHHPSKCKRPLASGALPLTSAIAMFPVLLFGAFALTVLFLPWQFGVMLALYYVMTLAYCVYLKRQVMADAIVLGGLYTIRIVAGSVAVGARLSFWLLAFSMFIFLSLALVKRYTELHTMQSHGRIRSCGRGYVASDLQLVSSLGTAAGYLSVLVLALYIQDPSTAMLYRHPQVIWFACPLLLYWVSRTWITAHRGLMLDDPIVFVAHDRVSLIVVALCALVFWAAI